MPKLHTRITDTLARKLEWQPVKTDGQPNRAGFTIYWDKDQAGFGLRVTDNGVRTFIAEQRVDGKTVRRNLGRADKIPAEMARKLGKKKIGELTEGTDTYAEKRAAAQIEKGGSVTFVDALNEYIADDASRKHPLKERTKRDYKHMVWPGGVNGSERYRAAGELASIANTPLNRITGPVMKTLYIELLKRGKTRAAYALRVLKAVLRYQGIVLVDNPFDKATAGKHRIRLHKGDPRKRIIKPEQLRAWWKAADTTPDGNKFQFMVLTGLRPGEASGLKVSDVDLAGGTISLLDTKNHKPHTVIMSREVKRIVAEAMRGKAPEDRLFINDPRLSQNQIIERSGVPFSAHDCRRTFSSISGGLLPGYVVKRLMNHADSGDVTQESYMQIDDATLRAAWQRVASSVMRKVEVGRKPPRKNAKVLPFRRGAVPA